MALLVSAALAGGAAYALVDAADSKGTTTATGQPLPGPTTAAPLEGPTGSPLVFPTEDAGSTATPTASPTASPSPSASPTGSPTPVATSATVTRYPYPSNPRTAAGLRFTASSRQRSGTTTTTVVTITASDGDGDITFGGLTWGDGTAMSPEAVPGHCPAYPSPTSAPGAYQPHADRRTFTFSHTYPSDQDYTVNVTVRSGNDECRPHGPTAESQSVALGVRFTHPTPSPTPSPTATEAPSTGAVDARSGD